MNKLPQSKKLTLGSYEFSYFSLLFVCIYIIGFIIFSSARYKADDDYIWFHLQGSDIHYSEKSDDIYNSHLAYLECKDTNEDYVFRADARKNLHKNMNYYGSSVFALIGGVITDKVFDIQPEKNYPRYLSVSMWLGFFLSLVFVLFVVIVVMFYLRDKVYVSALIIISSLLLVIGVYSFDNQASGRLIEQGPLLNSPLSLVLNNVHYLLNPAPAFSPFDMPPKARAMLLLLLVFLLRWKSLYLASYILMLGVSFFHQGYSGIILLMLIATDLFLRPAVFRNKKILFAAIFPLVLYLFRGYLWKDAVTVFSSYYLELTILLLLVGVAFVKFKSVAVNVMYSNSYYNLLLGCKNYQSDLIVILFYWLMSLVLFIPVSIMSDYTSSHYLWGQVHGRISGMLYPVYLFGITLFVFDSYKSNVLFRNKNMLKTSYVVAFLSFLLIVPALNKYNLDFINRAENMSKLHELKTNEPLAGTNSEIYEYIFYYSMIKTLDTGEGRLKTIFSDCGLSAKL